MGRLSNEDWGLGGYTCRIPTQRVGRHFSAKGAIEVGSGMRNRKAPAVRASRNRRLVNRTQRAELAFLGGYRLEGRDLLFHASALTFRTPLFLLFILGNGHCFGKPLLAFFANELVCGHDSPPVALRVSLQKNTKK